MNGGDFFSSFFFKEGAKILSSDVLPNMETCKIWVKFAEFFYPAFLILVHLPWEHYVEKKEQTILGDLQNHVENFDQNPNVLGVSSFMKRKTWLSVFKDKKYVFLIIWHMKSNLGCGILMMSAQINQLLLGIKFLLHTCGLENKRK